MFKAQNSKQYDRGNNKELENEWRDLKGKNIELRGIFSCIPIESSSGFGNLKFGFGICFR
jgi:hypothetical protein